jgi:lipid II:glycine glycyltransferase (peptidoglycan interpeptide bridge formation enzyme)
MAWDEFVVATPGGDLVQTTAWAEAKRSQGFEVLAVTVGAGSALGGGAQIVAKRLGPLGAVGYVARGPLMAPGGGHGPAEILDAIEAAARAARVRHLVVQPPEGGEAIEVELATRGYAAGAPAVAPSATMRIDLAPSLEQILARMSASKRNQVRRGQRAGVRITLGGRSDIEVFHALHQATAQRQAFAALSKSYLYHQWDALHPHGWAQLILAHHEGAPLAGAWLTAFGDTVTYRIPGSAGQSGRIQPNVACQWGAIQWAKAQGYRYYDLGGIDRRHAELLVTEQPLPEAFQRTPGAFKRELGGVPVLLPKAHQLTFNPVARALVAAAQGRLAHGRGMGWLIRRLRDG